MSGQTRYPYGTDPKWQPPPHSVRRTLHRLELWLAYHDHDNLAMKVRRVRIRVGPGRGKAWVIRVTT